MPVLQLPPRVAIVGSRTFTNLWLVRVFVSRLPVDTVVISGGAPGVDTEVERSARARNLAFEVYLADWDRYPQRAGVLRNGVLVRNSEHLVAFWDGLSPGTKDVVRQARVEGLGFNVFRADSILPDIEAVR